MTDDLRAPTGGDGGGTKGDRGPSLASEVARLTAENKELTRQLAKLPPVGPPVGTPVCFRRATESRFRAGHLLSDGYVEAVPRPGGQLLYAVIDYGDPHGTATKTTQRTTTNRPHDTLGGPETWHLPAECPCGHDPARCPFADGAPQPQAP